MLDILSAIVFVLGLTSIIFYVNIILKDDIPMVVTSIIFILFFLASLLLYIKLSAPEYYKVSDKETSLHEISKLDGLYKLHFNKKLKVKELHFDMPYSTILDYSIYRIYLDSVTYIDLYSTKFDSLDLNTHKNKYRDMYEKEVK